GVHQAPDLVRGPMAVLVERRARLGVPQGVAHGEDVVPQLRERDVGEGVAESVNTDPLDLVRPGLIGPGDCPGEGVTRVAVADRLALLARRGEEPRWAGGAGFG